jgi:predicted PhzF superfamily epimerase YddE/YHI9
LKAVDLLTINSDKLVLQKQVLELKEKSKDSEYIIKTKLEEKNVEIENMKGQMALMQQAQREILDLLKDPAKLLEALKEN